MSPSARHKLALCERNPGFPGRKLIFPHRRSRRGNGTFLFSVRVLLRAKCVMVMVKGSVTVRFVVMV